MKLSAAILALVAPAAALTKVGISVGCKGINMDKLSVQDVTSISNALEDAYNGVHGNSDNDDSELSNVHWGSIIKENLGQSSGWSGDYNCHLCPKKDFGALTVSDIADTMWQTKFAEALTKTGSPSFSKVTTCILTMSPQALDEEEKSQAKLSMLSLSSKPTAVNIVPKCNGLNLAKLSVADVTFAGNALQDSYNKVHSETDNDDSELSNVHWGNSVKANLGQSSGWSGDYNCHLCPKYDNAIFAIEAPDANMKNWQDEFVLGLVGSGRPNFKDVTKCDITMSKKGEATVVGESPKCGLRACADE